jgi:hypothetical protein
MNAIANTEPKHPVNYVFVDYENVKQIDLSVIGAKTVHLTLLLGPLQTRLDAALVEKLMEHSASVQLVRLQSAGKNALDFVLAFYLGKAANADPTAYFHIVSKDTGFDPLIEHLKSRHIRAYRHGDFTSLPFSGPTKPADAKSSNKGDFTSLTFSGPTKAPVVTAPEDPFTRVLEHLRKNTNNRPKRKKTLASHLKPLLGTSATEAGVHELIEKLHQAGRLTIGEKGDVTYYLDPK